MEDIEKYTKVDEVKEIFDRYLPYAIAVFGLENSWDPEVLAGRYRTAGPGMTLALTGRGR